MVQPLPNPESNDFTVLLPKELICPRTRSPLLSAVFLIPCHHLINEIAAKQLYNKLDDQHPQPCCVCDKMVTAYHPDPSVRVLMQSILRSKNEPASLHEADLKNQDSDSPAFPGKSAEFVLKSGEWVKGNNEGGDRTLEFISTTPGSLFTELNVFGYRDGSITLRVGFDRKHTDTVYHYLSKCGIHDLIQPPSGFYVSAKLSALKKLLPILTRNNRIPQPWLSLITTLIDKGNWKLME